MLKNTAALNTSKQYTILLINWVIFFSQHCVPEATFYVTIALVSLCKLLLTEYLYLFVIIVVMVILVLIVGVTCYWNIW